MDNNIELKVIKEQIQFAINEVKKKRSDKNLIFDWLTEAQYRVNKLIKSNK